MQDSDEVIPSSQPVIEVSVPKKTKRTPRQKKKRRSKLALTKKGETKENNNKSTSQSSKSSSNATPQSQPITIDIYAGLCSGVANSSSAIASEIDIYGAAKLLEIGNLNGLPPPKQIVPSKVFDSEDGLKTLKELIDTEQLDSEEVSSSQSNSILSNTTKQFLDGSYQLSEWPIENYQSPKKPLMNENSVQEQTDVSSVVESILNDFDDDDLETLEEPSRTPPVFFKKRQNLRTYFRVNESKEKKLVFDNDPCDEKPIQNSVDFVQNDENITEAESVEIDLNASRRIIENIANLSTFFTQSQTFELDFNASLSQEVDVVNEPIEEKIDDDISLPNESRASDKHLLDLDDHLLMLAVSPTAEMLKSSKRSFSQIITPTSSTTLTKRNSFNFATPSTSKAALVNEQRDFCPKRLRFDHTEQNIATTSSNPAQLPKNRGFATARGQTIQASSTSMAKYSKVFADVEAECQRLDPHMIGIEQNDECDKQLDLKRICDSNREAIPINLPKTKFNQATVVFKTAGGNKCTISDAKLENSRKLFRKEFDEFDMVLNENSPHKPELPERDEREAAQYRNNASAQRGFTTARGSDIGISAAKLQKYSKVYNEIDISSMDVAGPSTATSPMICKTPLTKVNEQSPLFATSTPNPNVQNVSRYSSITPINKNKENSLLAQESLGLNGNEFFDFFNNFDQNECTQRSIVETSFETSTIVPLDISILQNDVLHVTEQVKTERQQAFSQQQADCLKKPISIRPRVGSLSLEKLLRTQFTQVEVQPLRKYQRTELKQFGLPENVIDLTVDNATKFKFDMWNYYPIDVCRTNVGGIDMPDDMKLIMDGHSRVGLREISSAFLQCVSVDSKLVPDNWITNAFKWIVVKLAAMDRAFPHSNNGRYLTPENMLLQLKYRYDREIDKAERSAIRKIVEIDDTPAKRMVLFVSGILNENGTPKTLQLCDGWYAIQTSTLDITLAKAVQSKKIDIGTKLIIQGAELLGCVEGAHPLEMSSAVALKISANSARRARWYAKLGFCKESWPFSISLNSVSEHGGLITRMEAFVLRVYPLVYIIKETDGDNSTKTFLSSRKEKRQRRNEDHKRFEMAQKFYNEVAKEMEEEYEEQRKSIKPPTQKLKDIDNGEDLWKLLETSHDAESFEMDLSFTQKRLLNDYQTRINDKRNTRVSDMARDKLKNWANETKSTPMLKIRMIDAAYPNPSKTVVLNIWNFAEDAVEIRENTFVEVKKATAKDKLGNDILITAIGSSSIREISKKPIELHKQYQSRLIPLAELDLQTFKPAFNELDTIGYVFQVGEVNNSQFQSVFIVDAQKHILCIKFWKGAAHYAYEDVVQEGRFLIICHMDWRPRNNSYSKNIPQAFVNEYTTFTECAKSKERSCALNDLRDDFGKLNVDEYITECRNQLHTDVSGLNSTTTPLRPTNFNSSYRTPNQPSTSKQAAVVEKIIRLNASGYAPRHNYNLGARQSMRKNLKTPLRSPAPAAGNLTPRNENRQ